MMERYYDDDLLSNGQWMICMIKFRFLREWEISFWFSFRLGFPLCSQYIWTLFFQFKIVFFIEVLFAFVFQFHCARIMEWILRVMQVVEGECVVFLNYIVSVFI